VLNTKYKNFQKISIKVLTNGKFYDIILNTKRNKRCFAVKLLYIPEAKASHPLFFMFLFIEVTATNKVVTFFIFFLLITQVTLEAVPSIPAEFQQETFPLKK